MRERNHTPENSLDDDIAIAQKAISLFKNAGYTYAIVSAPGTRITFHKGMPNNAHREKHYPKYIFIDDEDLIPELIDSINTTGNDYTEIKLGYNSSP